MEITELQNRIEKTKNVIQKILKKIEKYKNRGEDDFKKEYQWLLDVHNGNWDEVKKTHWDSYIQACNAELERSERDLQDNQLKLQKYENQIAILDKRNSTQKIKILVDFLNYWKERMHDFIVDNLEVLKEYYKVNAEACDLHNNTPYEDKKKPEYTQKMNELKKREQLLKNEIHPLTQSSVKVEFTHNPLKPTWDTEDDTRTYSINEPVLDKLLEKEKEAKYWEMVNKVTGIVGNIEDASHLDIGPKGDIEGLIKGDKGVAELWTIGAGGYNIQCYHFRSFVRSRPEADFK